MSSFGHGRIKTLTSPAVQVAQFLGARPLPLILCAALVAAMPVLLFGFPNGHDAKLHLTWHSAFAAQLWAGELYPRWLTDVVWGLGGPVFYYYPPAGFYSSGALAPLFGDDPLGRHALGAASALALALSGATAFLWLRTMASARAAAVAAVIYMIIPYHLAVDLYLRSAYAEFWTFVWMPLVLYFMARVPDAPLRAGAGLALSYAALIATHLPTTILFTPFAVAYACFLFAREDRRWLVVAALGLGLGVIASSAYFLPAMLYQGRIASEMFWSEFSYAFSPSDILLKLTDEAYAQKHGSIAFFILLHISFLYVAYAIRVSWFARARSGPEGARLFHFWLIASCIVFFLVTPLSAFLWDIAATFKKVQFAWRYHAVLCVAVLPLCALALDAIPRLDPARRREARVGFGILTVGAFVVVVAAASHPIRFDDAEAESRVKSTSGVVELLPAHAAATLPPLPTFDEAIISRYERPWPRTRFLRGAGRAEVLEWAPRRVALAIDTADGGELAIGQLFYTGWTALKDGACCLDVGPEDTHALVRVTLPKGKYRLDLVLKAGPVERVAEVTSLVAIAVLVAAFVFGGRRQRKSKPA